MSRENDFFNQRYFEVLFMTSRLLNILQKDFLYVLSIYFTYIFVFIFWSTYILLLKLTYKYILHKFYYLFFYSIIKNILPVIWNSATGDRTRDLLITSSTCYHYTTSWGYVLTPVIVYIKDTSYISHHVTTPFYK